MMCSKKKKKLDISRVKVLMFFNSRDSGTIYSESLKHNIIESAKGRRSVMHGPCPRLGTRFVISLSPKATNLIGGVEKWLLTISSVTLEITEQPQLKCY